MAIEFTNPAIMNMLYSNQTHGYNFIDIFLTEVGFGPIQVTNYMRQITDPIESIVYEPDLFYGIELPPKTGNITQEVQKILISQPLGREVDPAEFIKRMGNGKTR